MRWCVGLATGLVCLGAAATAAAQGTPEDRTRPIRVGNLNVAVVGAGYVAHDHPTYDDHFLWNISYQRRILRREVRAVPLWVRVAMQFTEDDRTLTDTFTYWPGAGGDPDATSPSPEDVQEQTSDFGVRAELLADLLHNKNAALYGGGGFVVHLVNFTSRGVVSGSGGAAGIDANENTLAPSLVAGGRVFSAKHPYTFSAEARYGFTYGRTLGPQDQTPPQVATLDQFAIESQSNFSFEAGIGVHW